MIWGFFKSLLLLILISIVILVGGLFFLPKFISQDTIKNNVRTIFHEYTGGDITINGAASFSLFPRLSIFMKDAEIDYNKKKYSFDHFNFDLATLSLVNESLDTEVDAKIDGIKYNIELDIDRLKDFIAGQKSSIELQVNQPVKYGLNADVTVSDTAISLQDISLKLDKTSATGNLKLTKNTEKTKQNIDANINFALLDIDEVAGLAATISQITSDSKSEDGVSKTSNKKQFSWSNDKIDFSFLNQMNANINISAKEVRSSGLLLQNIKVDNKILAGTLNSKLHNLDIYGGSIKGNTTITSNNNGANIQKNFTISNIDLASLTKDMKLERKIDGKLNVNGNISTNGSSQKQFISTLNGKVNLIVKDGKIDGIDIASIANKATSAIKDALNSDGKSAQFKDLKASFNIVNGVVNNDDLFIDIPLSPIKGSGFVDLNKMWISYNIVPTIMGIKSIGVKLPITIKGSVFDPKIGLDTKGLLINNIDQLGVTDNKQVKKFQGKVNKFLNKKKLDNLVKPLGGALENTNIGGLLKGLTGGSTQ